MARGRLSLLGAIVLALIAGPSITASAEPLAVLAAVKGRVEVTPAKAAQPIRAAFGQPLSRGDKVSVGAGGSATLFFNDGNMVELAEKSTVTVGGRVTGRGPTATAGLPTEVFSEVSRFVTAGSRQTGLMAQSPMRGESDARPLILSPRQTDVLTDRPTFTWRRVGGATRYQVSLSAEGGPLWTRSSTGASLAYPADVAALARDADYLLEVSAMGEKDPVRKESAGFHVISAEQSEAIQANLGRIRESAGGEKSPAACYLAGSYLGGHGLFGDAALQFTALSEIMPESPAPHEALGKVYSEIGLTDLAAAEFQRALELTRTP